MNLNTNCLVKITYKNHAGITHEYVIRPQELFWGQSKFYTHPQLLLKSLKVIEDGKWEYPPVIRDFTVAKICDWQELDSPYDEPCEFCEDCGWCTGKWV